MKTQIIKNIVLPIFDKDNILDIINKIFIFDISQIIAEYTRDIEKVIITKNERDITYEINSYYFYNRYTSKASQLNNLWLKFDKFIIYVLHNNNSIYETETIKSFVAGKAPLINSFLKHFNRPIFKTPLDIDTDYYVFLDQNNPNLCFKKNYEFIHPCNSGCKTIYKCVPLSKSYVKKILKKISTGLHFVECSNQFTNSSIIKIVNPTEFLKVLEAFRIVYDL
jgi:hypothetical protein